MLWHNASFHIYRLENPFKNLQQQYLNPPSSPTYDLLLYGIVYNVQTLKTGIDKVAGYGTLLHI